MDATPLPNDLALRTLAHSSPDIVVRYDRECRRCYVNPACERLAGIARERLLRTTPRELSMLPAECAAELEQRLREVLDSGVEETLRLDWRGLDGQGHSHELALVPEFDGDGRASGVLAVGRDLSPLAGLRQQLLHSEQLLARLAAQRDAEQQDERRRVAWVLHEELAQVLASLRLRLATLAAEVGPQQPALQPTLLAMESQLEHALAAARDSVAALRGSAQPQSLAGALEALANEFRERSGIDCALQLDEAVGEIRGARAAQVLRIVQEALSNIARHAGAHHADVLLTRTDRSFALTVRDDGRGFAPDAQREPALGLLGMREGALALGGQLRLFSARGRGTVLKLRFPIDNDKGQGSTTDGGPGT